MKASELMIGDFVICDFAIAKPGITGLRVCQVVSVDGNRDCVALYDIEDEDRELVGRYGKHIEPIPITEEILKANGYIVEPSREEFCIYYEKNGNIIFGFDYDVEQKEYWLNIGYYRNIVFRYVHELQRILRCCGLWDLADNFKV